MERDEPGLHRHAHRLQLQRHQRNLSGRQWLYLVKPSVLHRDAHCVFGRDHQCHLPVSQWLHLAEWLWDLRRYSNHLYQQRGERHLPLSQRLQLVQCWRVPWYRRTVWREHHKHKLFIPLWLQLVGRRCHLHRDAHPMQPALDHDLHQGLRLRAQHDVVTTPRRPAS